jgi:ketosteroid isomerase-like protein
MLTSFGGCVALVERRVQVAMELNVLLRHDIHRGLSRIALSAKHLGFLQAMDPEVEWHSFFAELGEEGVYRGHDAMRQYVSDLNDAWEIVRPDVDDGLAVGDVVVLVGRVHYRGKASGVETDSSAGWLFKFRDGKVFYFRAFREPEQALGAVAPRE